MKIRSALYIDGFNLYHAINDYGEHFLKCCNLWKLGEIIIPSMSEELVSVAFCTAYYLGDTGKRARHERYMAALEAVGVRCVWGHYVYEDMDCRECSHVWKKPTEKETDINVALQVFDDAYQNLFDCAYLLTADSDQAATVRFFRNRFPEKRMITVSPPGRSHSKHILPLADGKIALSRDHIERCHFGPVVMVDGKLPVVRPHEYAPPPGWVPFEQRPAKKPKRNSN